MEAEGEVAYEELTITRKDMVTGKVTTITGKVKDVQVVMVSEEPTRYLDIGIPGEKYQFPIPPETITVYMTAEWVMKDNMLYLLTILDETVSDEQ